MMGGCVPLVVNLFMALRAGFRIHEKVRRNDAAHVGLRRSWKERRFWTTAFAFHRERRAGRVDDAIIGIGEKSLIVVPDDRQRNQHDQCGCEGLSDPEPPAAFLRVFFPTKRNKPRSPKRPRRNMRPE